MQIHRVALRNLMGFVFTGRTMYNIFFSNKKTYQNVYIAWNVCTNASFPKTRVYNKYLPTYVLYT